MSTVLQPAGAGNRRRIWRNAGAILGAGIVGFITFVAIFAPWLAPYDPFTIDLGRRVIPPMWMEGGTPANILGTDQLGRDYLSRLIYGARVSMIIGVATVITSGIIGTFLGVMGGFYGGRVDDAVMFAITARLSIPVVLVALAVAGSSMVGGGGPRGASPRCLRCLPRVRPPSSSLQPAVMLMCRTWMELRRCTLQRKKATQPSQSC